MVTATYLGHCLKHWDEDELDEPDLGCGFGHFVPVHERGHGKAFQLLTVALGRAVDATLKEGTSVEPVGLRGSLLFEEEEDELLQHNKPNHSALCKSVITITNREKKTVIC